jgi:putative acetyltransferase
VRIEVDDLTRPEVHALLNEHLANMLRAVAAGERARARPRPAANARHHLLERVEGDQLIGCGALKDSRPTHGEIKSMRTPKALRRRGPAARCSPTSSRRRAAEVMNC